MSHVSDGKWNIETVVVNEKSVINNEGFQWISVCDGKLEIAPAGLEFVIETATGDELTLVSRGQVFFAKFAGDSRQIKMTLTRPKFTETIVINARSQSESGSSESVEREVVQV